MHSIESGLGRTEAEPQEWNLRSLSSPGSPVQTQTAPAGPCGEQAEDEPFPIEITSIISGCRNAYDGNREPQACPHRDCSAVSENHEPQVTSARLHQSQSKVRQSTIIHTGKCPVLNP